jgi:C4-dicarboxylate-specific signal transduction histidine kinase
MPNRNPAAPEPMAHPPPGSSNAELQAFERLLAELSAGFIGLPAERIDAAIEDALRRIVLALDIDRSSLITVSPLTGRIETAHSWALEGIERTPPLDIVRSNPWGLSNARAGRPVVFARLDDLPPEAAVDKATWRSVGLKSHVGMPMWVAGQLRGSLTFGALRREREWPDELLARMRLLADVFASVLARQHAEAQRERTLDFERLASRTLSALLMAEPQDEARIIEAGLNEIAHFLGADRATLWETGDDQRFRRAHHWFADGVPAAETWSAQALPWIHGRLNEDALVRFARLDEVPAEAQADRRAMQALGVRSLLAVPVAVAGQRVGVFSVAAVRAECDWPDELLPGVRLLAEVFATLHVRRQAEHRGRAAESEAALWREQFAHVVRVHTVGEMSAALAHEITQPLGAIENYALAARRRAAATVPDLPKIVDLLERIVAQSARAADVVIDLERIATACIDLLRGECEQHDLHIELRRPGALPRLVADEVHVQQVLLNLLRNAIEAMQAAPPAAPRRIEVNIARPAPQWVSVQVADHGPGIAEAELEHVFEAFHSTKPLGLGVGLAICRRLIEAHGGSLRAAQNPAGGALFEFTLPLAPPQSA